MGRQGDKGHHDFMVQSRDFGKLAAGKRSMSVAEQQRILAQIDNLKGSRANVTRSRSRATTPSRSRAATPSTPGTVLERFRALRVSGSAQPALRVSASAQ